MSEEAINAFRAMIADGLKPSLLALNSLINAFGEDRRDAEAFAVLQYMKENVYCHSIAFTQLFVYFEVASVLPSYHMFIVIPMIAGLETRCGNIYYAYESFDSC